MEDNQLKPGDICKHFKGETLLDKNIYQILAVGVKYTGDKSETPLTDLVVYEALFQNGKRFTREYEDLTQMLSMEQQKQYHQTYRVQKLTKEELEEIQTPEFIKEKTERNLKKFQK